MIRYLFILLLSACSLYAKGERESEFFARILPDRSEVYAGDSMLVSVVLYASAPIAEAQCSSQFTINGKKRARVRKLNINRNATASRIRENNKVYYTLVWAQYVVAPTSTGTYTIPSLKFSGTLQYADYIPDLFDQMMGARPQYHKKEVKGKAPDFTFEVKEKPLRSTQDIMRSGTNML